MALVGALARGLCTLAVDRRPELVQRPGFFHGAVTALLVDNATTIAAATSRGQAALTAEYKLTCYRRRAADLPRLSSSPEFGLRLWPPMSSV